MLSHFVGVNIAVNNLAEAVAKYQALLGIEPTMIGAEGFAFPGLKGAAFNFNGVMINLIASTEDSSSVARFLQSRGEGVFLVSIGSNDIEADVAALSRKGIQCLLPQVKSGEFGKVNFIHPKQLCGVQLEIFEASDKHRKTVGLG